MSLEIISVDAKLPELRELENIYNAAFPLNERAPFRILLKKSRRGNVDFLAYYHDGKLCGMTYQLCMDGFVYLFYLAVSADMRGRGFGSEILQTLKLRYPGQSIFLSMEQLDPSAGNYDQRLKRRDFYAANGFDLLGRKVREGPVVFELAGTDSRITAAQYKKMMNSYMGILRYIVKTEFIE